MSLEFAGYIVAPNGGASMPVSRCNICQSLVEPTHMHPEERIELLKRDLEGSRSYQHYVAAKLRESVQKVADLERTVEGQEWEIQGRAREDKARFRASGWVIEP